MYVVTLTRAQSREIHSVPYQVATVTQRKFFGYELTSIEGTAVNVADVEKTLVDCTDHPEYCGGIRGLAKAMVAADEKVVRRRQSVSTSSASTTALRPSVLFILPTS